MTLGVLIAPVVYTSQISERSLRLPAHRGRSKMLYLVTGRAQCDQTNQALHVRFIIVIPHFMALDGVTATLTSADLATVFGVQRDLASELVPIRSG